MLITHFLAICVYQIQVPSSSHCKTPQSPSVIVYFSMSSRFPSHFLIAICVLSVMILLQTSLSLHDVLGRWDNFMRHSIHRKCFWLSSLVWFNCGIFFTFFSQFSRLTAAFDSNRCIVRAEAHLLSKALRFIFFVPLHRMLKQINKMNACSSRPIDLMQSLLNSFGINIGHCSHIRGVESCSHSSFIYNTRNILQCLALLSMYASLSQFYHVPACALHETRNLDIFTI